MGDPSLLMSTRHIVHAVQSHSAQYQVMTTLAVVLPVQSSHLVSLVTPSPCPPRPSHPFPRPLRIKSSCIPNRRLYPSHILQNSSASSPYPSRHPPLSHYIVHCGWCILVQANTYWPRKVLTVATKRRSGKHGRLWQCIRRGGNSMLH